MARQQIRRTTEPLSMPVEARPQIGRILASTLREDVVATDDASFDFVEEHLAAKLRWFTRFVSGPKGRPHLDVRLEEAQEFLLGGDDLTKDHPARRVRDRLINQRQKVGELLDQTLCLMIHVLGQTVADPFGVRFGRLGDPDQLGIGSLETFGNFFPFAAGHPVDLLRPRGHPAARSEDDSETSSGAGRSPPRPPLSPDAGGDGARAPRHRECDDRWDGGCSSPPPSYPSGVRGPTCPAIPTPVQRPDH